MNLPAIPLSPAAEQLVERFGGPRRVMIAGVGLLTVLAILGLSQWATRPAWVPVFSGLPLETVGEVTGRLDEAGVPYRLEQNGGQILVQTDDVARTRVMMAQQGLPAVGRPGLELFDQPSWGMTDFTQRINYRRALEGELERTIGKMRGVERAQVHLAIEEARSIFAEQRPAEASVVLAQRGGQAASPEVVLGIQHLVASSVDGMASDAVTVLDDAGRLLSAPNDGSLAGLTNRQLTAQREVESHLEQKAEQLVSQVVGPGNARVQVAAELSFDRVERTVETVDPDLQVTASEQRAEIVPGAEGGAGSVSSTTNYENSRSTEVFASAAGTVRRVTVAVLVNHRAVEGADGALTTEARAEAELAQIEALVRSAVGVNDARGDVVSVASMPFTMPDMTEPAPTPLELARQFQRPALTLFALLLVAFVGLRAIRTLRPEPEPVEAAQLAAGGAEGALGDGEGESAGALEEPEEDWEKMLSPGGFSAANQRMRMEVVKAVQGKPEVAVRLARAWLREV